MEKPFENETAHNQAIKKMTKIKPLHYLEKILNRVRFSKVNLQSFKSIDKFWWSSPIFWNPGKLDPISNRELKRLAAVMKSAKNVQDLTLHFYYIPLEDIQCFDLSKSLKNLRLLQKIDLLFAGQDHITDFGIYSLSQSLKEASSLNTFQIDISGSPKITDKSCYYLSQGFKRLPLLHTLHLSFSRSFSITDRGLEFLSQGLKRVSSLEWVNLRFEQCERITDAGFSQLSESLTNLKFLWGLDVTISDCNGISDASLSHFSECFKRLDGLERFDLKIKSNNITDVGMERLGNSFKNLTSLQVTVLQIESSSISDGGLISLGAGLMGLRSLIHPYFIFNFSSSVTDSSFDQFFRSLSQMVQLKSIQLDSNGSRKWNDKELGSLGRALKKLPSLEFLRLSFKENEFTDKGLIDLSKGLGKFPALEKIDINFSNGGRIGDQGLKNLGKELRKVPLLKSVRIGFQSMQQTDVTDSGVESFCKEIKRISCLRELFLRLPKNSKITNKGRYKMLECLKDLEYISFYDEKDQCIWLHQPQIIEAWKELAFTLAEGEGGYFKNKKSIILKGVMMLFLFIILEILYSRFM